MTIIYTCDPNLELAGHTAHALLESINRDNYFDILERHGFADIDETVWYPLQDLLNVMNDMNERGGTMMDFVSIGMVGGATSILPPQIECLSLREFFLSYGNTYQRIHRNGDAGEIQAAEVEENHLVLTLLDVPYPDDMMYGVFYSYARRFARGAHFTVAYDDELTRRDLGGDSTVVHITWE